MAYFIIGLILVVLVVIGVKAFRKREFPYHPSILNEHTANVDIKKRTQIELVQNDEGERGR